MMLLHSITIRLGIIILFAAFFSCGCATVFEYPLPMPDGSVAYAKYKNPKFLRDNDIELIVRTPNGIVLELRKKETSNAEKVAEATARGLMQAVLMAAKASAGGGALEN